MRRRRRRVLGGTLSLAGHAAALLALALTRPPPMAPAPPPPVPLAVPATIVRMPKPPPPVPAPEPGGGGAAAAEPAPEPPPPAPPEPKPEPPEPKPPAKAVAKPRKAVPRPIPPDVTPIAVAGPPAPPAPPTVSEAQLAGAMTADSPGAWAGSGSGSGGGSGSGAGAGSGAGGACNMTQRLQAALRRNAKVQAMVAERRAGARPLLVWDGDWVLSAGQDGKGLAGLRQAIAVEVAFAPEACRRQAMRGLVVISLGDRPGAPRLVLGAPSWRWQGLTMARGVRASGG